ncbi:MAG: 30S ribosomal protein S3 [candidate division WS2 bacterium]|uniref:Small ribosomal subunit protein uS3 n=1 Tax=Psychracetigena formicireducens TaxID=2986056 RepID=A0A9E2BFI1_PSYF1|nr:30S ribosomal protein S3 [Candidatus Psychracetigena formicireducens]MBT9144663.1 30S ribosomal protein S3 [Candidatus Psychracetigena formicireducens]
MGQKVHPTGFRIGLSIEWRNRWFAEGKLFSEYLKEDYRIRKLVKEKFYQGGISLIEIERMGNRVKVIIHTARPGMIIGRHGAITEELRNQLEKITQKQVSISIEEQKEPSLNAQLIAENVASQIEKRVSHKRAMKQAIFRAIKSGAKGIKISCSGRLGGAEIARTEWYREGRVPLHTIRADIDYGSTEALIKFGRIGIKVWVFSKMKDNVDIGSKRRVMASADARTGKI